MPTISCTGCLGLSEVISVQFTLEMRVAASNREKDHQNPLFLGFNVIQGHRCWYPEIVSAVLVMIRSKFMSTCNRSLTRLVDSSRNRAFWRGNPNLMLSYRLLLEPTGSKLTPVKSTLSAENFLCKLSWFISNGYGACPRSRNKIRFIVRVTQCSTRNMDQSPTWGRRNHSR